MRKQSELSEQKRRIPCEMYDKVNYMCRRYMDRMARFELDYGFIVDKATFLTAVDEWFKKAPVFLFPACVQPDFSLLEAERGKGGRCREFFRTDGY